MWLTCWSPSRGTVFLRADSTSYSTERPLQSTLYRFPVYCVLVTWGSPSPTATFRCSFVGVRAQFLVLCLFLSLCYNFHLSFLEFHSVTLEDTGRGKRKENCTTRDSIIIIRLVIANSLCFKFPESADEKGIC